MWSLIYICKIFLYSCVDYYLNSVLSYVMPHRSPCPWQLQNETLAINFTFKIQLKAMQEQTHIILCWSILILFLLCGILAIIVVHTPMQGNIQLKTCTASHFNWNKQICIQMQHLPGWNRGRGGEILRRRLWTRRSWNTCSSNCTGSHSSEGFAANFL